MPKYALLLIALAALVFVGAGVFMILRPGPVAKFARSRGVKLRTGAIVPSTAGNVRIIGIGWVAGAGAILAAALVDFASGHGFL